MYWILRYLYATLDEGILFKGKELKLEAYAKCRLGQTFYENQQLELILLQKVICDDLHPTM